MTDEALRRLGWNEARQNEFAPLAAAGLVAGRVSLEHNHVYRVLTGSGERLAEADASCDVLGAAWRVNLRLPDRALGRDPDQMRAVANLVRRAQPRVIAIPYWSDRHPDHVAASHLLTEAIFSAGLRRYDADGDAWKPQSVCYYFINDSVAPSFVVDVSEHYATKRRALACFVSQFRPLQPDAVATRLTSSGFTQLIESRDAQFGALAGVAFAEGIIVKHPVLRPHLLP